MRCSHDYFDFDKDILKACIERYTKSENMCWNGDSLNSDGFCADDYHHLLVERNEPRVHPLLMRITKQW